MFRPERKDSVESEEAASDGRATDGDADGRDADGDADGRASQLVEMQPSQPKPSTL